MARASLMFSVGADGTMRTTYCFRHTYATFRLQMGVDVYFLAQQMGTSVQMIEKHYGHVNTIRHADRVLMGMEGWDPVTRASTDTQAADDADDRESAKTKAKAKQTPNASSRPKR
jgi:integrase